MKKALPIILLLGIIGFLAFRKPKKLSQEEMREVFKLLHQKDIVDRQILNDQATIDRAISKLTRYDIMKFAAIYDKAQRKEPLSKKEKDHLQFVFGVLYPGIDITKST
jgi:hypothetical protein